MSKSYIKQLIEKNQKSIAKRTATGLLSLAVLTGSLTACNQVKIPGFSSDTNESNMGQVFDPSSPAAPGTYQPTFSDTYQNAKANWQNVWFNDRIDSSGKLGFQLKCAPFTFLQERGVVDVDEDGYLYAYGNEDYTNNDCIKTHAFIDEATKANELYLLVQYISAPINTKGSNDNTFVATWMLRYDLSNDCYKDLLALNGDYKNHLLIQQIDKEYEPQIISESLIQYDEIKNLDLFKSLPYAPEDQITLTPTSASSPYVANIDHDNMTITVNFTSKDNSNQIYSYTYNLKDSPRWQEALENVNNDYMNNLTKDDIMHYYDSFLGKVLYECRAAGYTLSPSNEHKASAQLKYDWSKVIVSSSSADKYFEQYENGRIQYPQINQFTKNYSSSDEYNQ